MCGRVNVSDHEGLRSLLAMMGMQVWPSAPAHFNVAPTSILDVIMHHEGAENLQLTSMRWGFAPTDTSTHRKHLFNARSETVFSKPSFRSAARALRAIVPVNGYYEWRSDSQGKKQAFHISDASKPTLAMAAIFQPSQRSSESGTATKNSKQEVEPAQLTLELVCDKSESVEKQSPKSRHSPAYDVCVLTMPANQQMSKIHHRMPVLMTIDQALSWITEGDKTMLQMLTQLDRQPPLTIKPVTNFVNNAANDGPECLASSTNQVTLR